MIDGLFPSGGSVKLEETKLALTRYFAILPYFSFCPHLHHGIKSFCNTSAKWYVTKYDDMFAITKLGYDNKTEIEQLNSKIQAATARTMEWSYTPQVFLTEFHALKTLPPRTNVLEALYNLVKKFNLEDWTKFLKMTIATQKVYESVAALYYECTLNNRQIGGFDVLNNLKLAFEIKSEFIRKLAIRISFIYKENSEHSFSESQFQLEKLSAYVLADGKEPITLLEQLIHEKNEIILQGILKELEIPFVDGLIQICLNKRQARNVEFLMRFPHELKDEKLRACVAQFPAPPRKNTIINTIDEFDPDLANTNDGFCFVERRLT